MNGSCYNFVSCLLCEGENVAYLSHIIRLTFPNVVIAISNQRRYAARGFFWPAAGAGLFGAQPARIAVYPRVAADAAGSPDLAGGAPQLSLAVAVGNGTIGGEPTFALTTNCEVTPDWPFAGATRGPPRNDAERHWQTI